MSSTTVIYLTLAGMFILPVAGIFVVCNLFARYAIRPQTEEETSTHIRLTLGAMVVLAAQTKEKRKQDIMSGLIMYAATISDLKEISQYDVDAVKQENEIRGDNEQDVAEELDQTEQLSKKKKSGRERFLNMTRKKTGNTYHLHPDEEKGTYNDSPLQQQMQHDAESTANAQCNLMLSISLGNEENQKEQDIIDRPAMHNTLGAEGNIDSSGQGRLRDASCSICLEEYTEGDIISRSRNPACIHAFHKECIIPWLMKHDECPNCRTTYLVGEEPEGKYNDEKDILICNTNHIQDIQLQHDRY